MENLHVQIGRIRKRVPVTGWRMKEARRSLNRLRRAVEKAEAELSAVAGALRHAEADDFPAADFDHAQDRLRDLGRFIDEQEQRLQDKILQAGGLEPGRVRRQ